MAKTQEKGKRASCTLEQAVALSTWLQQNRAVIEREPHTLLQVRALAAVALPWLTTATDRMILRTAKAAGVSIVRAQRSRRGRPMGASYSTKFLCVCILRLMETIKAIHGNKFPGGHTSLQAFASANQIELPVRQLIDLATSRVTPAQLSGMMPIESANDAATSGNA